jgi:hypothetical protein
MRVFFKCKASGNKLGFSNEDDIQAMRKEEGYEEIKDAVQLPEETPKQEIKAETKPAAQEVKKRGRPSKEMVI